jgi:hypothetical protein
MICEKCDGGGTFLYSRQVIPMPAPYSLAPTLAVIASGIINPLCRRPRGKGTPRGLCRNPALGRHQLGCDPINA